MRGKSPSARVLLSLALALSGVGLVFGLANADGFLIYFPFVANEGPTATPTATATPTPGTPTATPTPTRTPTPRHDCVAGRAHAPYSSVSVSSANNPAWADNEMLMQVHVVLRDQCNNAITDGRAVTLLSSRNAPTMTVDHIAAGPVINENYFFNVRSGTVGVSHFTAVVGRDSDTDSITIVFPVSGAPTGTFVCVAGVQTEILTNTLTITYTNPAQPSLNRRLISLNVAWPANGSRKVESVAFGDSSNIVWQSANGVTTSPLVINAPDWTGVNRSVVSGTSRAVRINFSYILGGTGTYTTTAGWDNGGGGSLCYSSPVVVNPPW